ncbi:succinylglutamate desuccinylase/aspartoacylase family protein [bacterium]|nr:succinylglutamate desuccinylase/aspartoacylase family protein [bacterium]
MRIFKRVEEIILPHTSMGTSRKLQIIRYGNLSSTKKAYIQTGLHADEPPGFVVMHYLLKLLDEADREGKIKEQIVLVPTANPIGLSQWQNDQLQGRFEFSTGVNFNRSYPELTEEVAKKIGKKLQKNAEKNIQLIREAQLSCLNAMNPEDEGQFLKLKLMSLAVDADIVLDLHCDYEACLHIYMGTPLWPDASDLTAQLGVPVTLLAENSGGEPFDEACSKIWWELAAKFPDYSIPSACLSATVELRGINDVSHENGLNDARNIFLFLKRRGYIAGVAPKLPKLIREATPLTAVEHLKSEIPGVVIYRREIGETVKKGDVIAEIVNPLEQNPAKRITRIRSKYGGYLFTKNVDRYARPNRILAKIAGVKQIKGKGKHLLTA